MQCINAIPLQYILYMCSKYMGMPIKIKCMVYIILYKNNYNKTTLLINIQYHTKYYSLHQCLVIIVQQVCHEGHLIGDSAHFIHSLSLNGGCQEEFQFPFFGFEPLDIKHS